MGAIAIVAGGGPVRVPPAAQYTTVIAADGGLDAACAAGLPPTVLVGDLDSISAAGLEWARQHGVSIERHERDKDATDTALAIRHAVRLAARCDNASLDLLGHAGTDRLDHLLATLVALGAPETATFVSVRAVLGGTIAHVVHPGRSVALAAGTAATFSLLALHGRCSGVDVDGARWPLRDAVLDPASTLGISNEQHDGEVVVGVRDGVLTVVVPETTR